MTELIIRAPGKIILSGEHAVVYGQPAIVAAVDRYLTLKATFSPSSVDHSYWREQLQRFNSYSVSDLLHQLNAPDNQVMVNLESDITIGCGMGSSAALAVALSALVLTLADEPMTSERINELAYQLEKQMHGNPSGADNSIVVWGGCLRFQKKSEKVKDLKPLPVNIKIPTFFLVNTGRPQENTGEMVALVRAKQAQDEANINAILTQIGHITEQIQLLLVGQVADEIDELISANERLLEQLGVVSPAVQKLIRQIAKLGGSAKITGAGGAVSGSGMLLLHHPNTGKLSVWAKTHHHQLIPVKLGGPGLKYQRID